MPPSEAIDVPALLRAFDNQEFDLICVLGPTASGKTRYAVSLAKELNSLHSNKSAEIISADSRQVYKGMDIGTGKDLQEYGDIPYHLIDIVEAGYKYNIYEYQRDFEAAFQDIVKRGGIPILCGGSGLYISAAVNAYSLADVQPDMELRAELEQEDLEDLREKLAELKPADPSVYDSKKRLIRALEIAFYEQEHHITLSSFKPKRAYYIGTLVSPDKRNELIDKRLDERLKNGLVEEVKRLLDSGISAETLAYYGLEYKFVSQYILGILSYDDMRRMLADAIHRFAKRQMTWCRSMEDEGTHIHWTET